MDYSNRGGQHNEYAHILSGQLSQLNINPTRQDIGPLSSNYGRRGTASQHSPYTGYIPKQLHEVPVPLMQQQSHHVFQQNQDMHNYSSHRMTYKDQAYLGSSAHGSSPSPSQYVPTHLSSSLPSQHQFSKQLSGLQSPHSTSTQSQNSSPHRSVIGGTHISSSMSPRTVQDIESSANAHLSLPSKLGDTRLNTRLGEGRLNSTLGETRLNSTLSEARLNSLGESSLNPSIPSTLRPLDQVSSIPSSLSSVSPVPYASPVPAQEQLTDMQLGLSWNPSNNTGYTQQLHQGPSSVQQNHTNMSMLGMNQCSSQPTALPVMNGQTTPLDFQLQQNVQYQTQQYINIDPYSSFQQQQQQQQQQQYNNGYNQLQSNNFQFNVEYLEGSDPSAYTNYYYGDYQYTDSYSDNLLDTGFPGTYGPGSRSTTPYGDKTVEELGPEEVRWFYKVEGDKKWTPFIGYDSLRIEWKYRDVLQDIGTTETQTTSPGNKQVGPATTPSPSREKQQEGVEGRSTVAGIVVRGGLYEVNVQHRKCQSIYWEGEEYLILRGIWFFEGTWGPLEESVQDRIENEHLARFRGHPLLSGGTQRVDDAAKQVVHSLSLPEGEVDWFSAGEIYLTSDATPSRLMRSVGKRLGFQKTGCKLHRGYSIDAAVSDKPPDINHIVFVIHGIGQKMERGRIIKNCTGLRESVSHLKNKYFPSLCHTGQTVEFFPVEWRSALVLDAGVIDNITPHKILQLRQMLNASFMDIMYYNSPLYREEIISGLTQEMNRLYTMFTCRNPYFEANGGKVSMVAHSLGCVITYDIVTGWHPARHSDRHLVDSLASYIDGCDSVGTRGRSELRAGLKELLCQHHHSRAQPTLNFKIENFFCLGSPLAVFLALRSKQQAQGTSSKPGTGTTGTAKGGSGGAAAAAATAAGDASDLIPQKLCKRLLNIFHPSDPVAYRIEPLLCPEYANIAPVVIHSHNSTEKTPYSEMPLEPIIREREAGAGGMGGGGAEGGKSKATTGGGTGGAMGGENSETDTPVSSVPSTPVKGGSSAWSLWGLMKGSKRSCEAAAQDLTSFMQEGKGLPERTDFVLREGSMESSYISALTSHTSYWTNYDVSHFLLNILYPDVQPASASASTSVPVSSVTKTDMPKPSQA